MRITFLGAAQEVTGSMHLIEVNDRRILLECGLFQGRRADTYERNLHFPFDPKSIDAMILSHAHIDHSGNIPNLVKQGFKGNVWCTAATRNLCTYMLLDSGHIQESDAEYLNKKRARRGEPPIQPIYTRADAQAVLDQLVSVGLHRTVTVIDGVDVTFYNAGHILGSAFEVIDIREHSTGKHWSLLFSGDLGRDEIAILKSPEFVDTADIAIIESTYGDRLHERYEEAYRELRDAVRDTVKRRGKLIIPSFAVGRAQEIVFALNRLEASGDIPELPVFVDSPLAVSATEVFRMHPEDWDQDVLDFIKDGGATNPFDSSHIEYVRDVKRSKQLNFITQPAIIISASGMAENGRILHHLQNNIESPSNTILFVGYQAENTLGRRLHDGAKQIRIFGEECRVGAKVESIEGYSAHADQTELRAWAGHLERSRLQKFFVVHGEQKSAMTLATKLTEDGFQGVTVPERGASYEF